MRIGYTTDMWAKTSNGRERGSRQAGSELGERRLKWLNLGCRVAFRRGTLLVVAALALLVAAVPARGVVINEVYSYGGIVQATYQHDYVELYNPRATSYVLTNHVLQHSQPIANWTWLSVPFPEGMTIEPNGYLVVRLATQGMTGTLMTDYDLQDSSIQMAAQAGRLRLISNPNVAADAAVDAPGVLDAMGYGSVTYYETAVAAFSGSSKLSMGRKPDGYDTNNNSTDFIKMPTTPGAANTPEPGSLVLVAAVLTGLSLRTRRAPVSSRRASCS